MKAHIALAWSIIIKIRKPVKRDDAQPMLEQDKAWLKVAAGGSPDKWKLYCIEKKNGSCFITSAFEKEILSSLRLFFLLYCSCNNRIWIKTSENTCGEENK